MVRIGTNLATAPTNAPHALQSPRLVQSEATERLIVTDSQIKL